MTLLLEGSRTDRDQESEATVFLRHGCYTLKFEYVCVNCSEFFSLIKKSMQKIAFSSIRLFAWSISNTFQLFESMQKKYLGPDLYEWRATLRDECQILKRNGQPWNTVQAGQHTKHPATLNKRWKVGNDACRVGKKKKKNRPQKIWEKTPKSWVLGFYFFHLAE